MKSVAHPLSFHIHQVKYTVIKEVFFSLMSALPCPKCVVVLPFIMPLSRELLCKIHTHEGVFLSVHVIPSVARFVELVCNAFVWRIPG